MPKGCIRHCMMYSYQRAGEKSTTIYHHVSCHYFVLEYHYIIITIVVNIYDWFVIITCRLVT